VTRPDRLVLRVAPGSSRCQAYPSRAARRSGALASGTAVLVAPVVPAALGAALDLRAAYLLAVLPLAAALATTAWREPSCPTP
jgi:hypothetical protein